MKERVKIREQKENVSKGKGREEGKDEGGDREERVKKQKIEKKMVTERK